MKYVFYTREKKEKNMRIFQLKDLSKNFVEETKLKGIVKEEEIQAFKIGELVLPHVTKTVCDLKEMMKHKGYHIWTVKPEHPFYREEQIKKIAKEVKKMPVKGVFINYKRDIELVYDLDDVLHKNGLTWVNEKEFILNRFVLYVKEEDINVLPKAFKMEAYVKWYGYKKYGATFSKVYKIKKDFSEKLVIKKEEILSTDHLCHITDIPILRTWMNERKVKYGKLKNIKGITKDWYIVFDLKEKDWHKVRVKLTVEPPIYQTPYH